jgi:hypothetical protein
MMSEYHLECSLGLISTRVPSRRFAHFSSSVSAAELALSPQLGQKIEGMAQAIPPKLALLLVC